MTTTIALCLAAGFGALAWMLHEIRVALVIDDPEPFGDFPHIPSSARPLSRTGPGLGSPHATEAGDHVFAAVHGGNIARP